MYIYILYIFCTYLSVYLSVYLHIWPSGTTWQRGSHPPLFSPASWAESLSTPLPVGHIFPASFAGSLASPKWQMLQCYRSLTLDASWFTHTFQMIPSTCTGLNSVSELMYLHSRLQPRQVLVSYQTHACQRAYRTSSLGCLINFTCPKLNP